MDSWLLTRGDCVVISIFIKTCWWSSEAARSAWIEVAAAGRNRAVCCWGCCCGTTAAAGTAAYGLAAAAAAGAHGVKRARASDAAVAGSAGAHRAPADTSCGCGRTAVAYGSINIEFPAAGQRVWGAHRTARVGYTGVAPSPRSEIPDPHFATDPPGRSGRGARDPDTTQSSRAHGGAQAALFRWMEWCAKGFGQSGVRKGRAIDTNRRGEKTATRIGGINE